MTLARTDHTWGIGLAVLAGCLFGTAGLFTRAITGVAPVGIAASRLLIGWLLMGLLIWRQRRGAELRASLRHLPTWLLLGVIASVHFVLFVAAIQNTLVANALILVNTAPLLVLLLAPLFLREHLTTRDALGVALAFAGASLIVGFDRMLLTPTHWRGDLCALGSAVSYALYVIFGRNLRARYAAPVIMFWFFGLGALFLLGGGLLFDLPLFLQPTRAAWFFLALLGLLPTGLGHLAYNASLKYLPATQASTLILLEPVTGTLLALIFLRESPPLTSWLGMLIAFAGISLAALAHLPSAPPRRMPESADV